MAGCVSSGSSDIVVAPPKLVLVQPDSKLIEPCADPSKQIVGTLEKTWGIDRKNLANCRDRKQALVDFYKFRDEELMK